MATTVQQCLLAAAIKACLVVCPGAGLKAIVAVLLDANIPLPCKGLAAAVLKAFLVPQQHATPVVNP